ncbi:MAG TPA: TerC/Alx family metal homeostasis membrane protein, partial [Spirochaetota bacterium]
MNATVLLWIVFSFLITAALVIDLGFANRKSHEISLKESLRWTAIWVSLAMIFCLGIYIKFGSEKSMLFMTGYILEYSLSVDNLFVFLLIFSFFKVPKKYQHRVLFWGIIVALVTRILFIFGGVVLVSKFNWVLYIFGAFLVYTGIRMAFKKEDSSIDLEKNIFLRLIRKVIPISTQYDKDHFITKKGKFHYATPLLVVLLVIEATDIIFAVDSIPAILSITTDPFIVITSNVFAIVGLRSLFFALSRIINLFHYL